jgi:hypothetical protein
VAGDRTLTEEEFKVQVRQAIEAERAEVHAPPEADRPRPEVSRSKSFAS